MKPVHFLAFVLALAFVGTQISSARSTYRPIALKQLKLEKNAAAQKVGCQLCHLQAFGGAGWNGFGQALKDQMASSSSVNQALFDLLKKNADSDKDGFKDVLEVVAGTLPGDAKSKPSAKAPDLEAKLKKMGGVTAFKP
jgi:hypothetical protein